MATPKLFISKLLRRSRPTPFLLSSSSSYSHSSIFQSHHRLTNSFSKPTLHFPSSLSTVHWFSPYNTFSLYRSISTSDSSTAQSEPSELGLGGDINGLQEISESLVDFSSGGEESILPVRVLISVLDCYHDLTGFPWWIIIASSTLALRITLFPILILQLNKLKRIGELFPKLPPPLPPPLSGRSFIDQLTLFHKERRAVGCPSFLWFLAPVFIQFPCFLLWLTSIRRMSLDHHPGFDCGGTLWFQNLTEIPHGAFGPIFPSLIAGLYFVNVQISFRRSFRKDSGLFGLLLKYYKIYLDVMTVPILFITFYVPQGSLVYWFTNSSLTLIQQLFLNHRDIRKMLGLPDKEPPLAAADRGEMGNPGVTITDPPRMQRNISIQNLSPQELLALSIKWLAKGQRDNAIPLLRLALDKDPEYVRALVVMGQTLMQKGLLAEATEYLERAISKLFLVGHSQEVEDVDLLILASQWAGVACIRQGKNAEGIVHLERLARLKEPEDAKSKAHYFDGLVLLSSALYREGLKVEASNYLRMAAAYNSEYKVYLEQCENDEDNFVSDLVNSRRGDY